MIIYINIFVQELNTTAAVGVEVRPLGFDHGVGHPLLLLYDAKVPSGRKNKAFKALGHYAEWPKVADAVIKAR
jgi:hypothetical protein